MGEPRLRSQAAGWNPCLAGDAPESFRPELVEMLSFRLGAARWLERAGEEMGDWLADG